MKHNFPFAPQKHIDRFIEKLSVSNKGCWEWSAGCSGDGYSAFKLFGRQVAGHRVSKEWQTGRAIPAGKHIDHLCRNKICVNPFHLEVVTPKENQRRGTSPASVNGKKTHCIRGHEFTNENTLTVRLHGKIMGRQCRICHRARVKKSIEKSKNSILTK